MSEVLSQYEIDSLLNALNSGELDATELVDEDKRQIKDYDFKRPLKFSKEHLRTLEFIFEHYARLLNNRLSTYLRKNVQIEVVNSEALVFSEFTNSLSSPVLIGVADLRPLEGSALIELSTNLGFTIIDRLLGGKGAPLNDNKREFTDIEINILTRIFDIFVNLLIEPWSNVVELKPRLERIETNSQFTQIVDPNVMTAILTLKVTIGKGEGMLNFCIPYSTVDGVIEKLNTRHWYSSSEQVTEGDYKETIEKVISRTQIPIRAILGKSTITVNDFIGLQPGDIIKLDNKVGEELDVYVGNLKKFKANPGTFSKNYALQITSILREE
ncbi:MAG: flagellar motor switch protein FliM [Clostridiales bacterium]|mgnify:CR=1|nr:flagellar motor switch protein FliM [Clostridiales bacterium]